MKNNKIEKIVEERFEEFMKIDRTFEEITSKWCPKVVNLKNHGDTDVRCSLTCKECWKKATEILK